MNTFQLDCFLAVVETLNFARAAEHLNITQPAVTHQIHSLEAELNAKLFRRTTRTVELTTAGGLFLNDARTIRAVSIRAKKRFENPAEQEMQMFSIACHNYAQLFLLPEALRRLAEEFPHLHPRLQVVPFRHLYRLLEEESVDAVIGIKEPDSVKTPGIYKELKKISISCICSCDSPLAARKTVSIEELGKEKFVLNDPAKAPEAIARLQGQLMDGRSPSDFYFCESSEAAIVLVGAGFGISILPDLFIPTQSSFVRIPVEGTEPVSFGIYYNATQGNTLLGSFIRILKSCFKDEKSQAP